MALHGTPSQNYLASLAVWDHTVLPATWHKWTHPTLTPARKAGTRFTYPIGMEGWVDLVTDYILRFTRPQMVSHPSSNAGAHSWQSNSQPVDYKSDALSITLPSHQYAQKETCRRSTLYRLNVPHVNKSTAMKPWTECSVLTTQ